MSILTLHIWCVCDIKYIVVCTVCKMHYWVSTDAQSPVEESARVAQVMDQLEKRDKTIEGLRRENAALKVCTYCVCLLVRTLPASILCVCM